MTANDESMYQMPLQFAAANALLETTDDVTEALPLHVDLAGPRSAPFGEETLSKLQAIVAEQADLPAPAFIGRVIALPPEK